MGQEAFDIANSTELDLTAVSEALRLDHTARLKVQLEVMIRALEAIEPPKDHVGLEKFAKAIAAANKAVREVNAPEKAAKQSQSDKQKDDDMDQDKTSKKIRPGTAINSSGDPQYDGMYDWQIELERKLIKLARARSQELGDDPGDGTGAGPR